VLNEIASPIGVPPEDRLMFPFKPFKLASVILEVANEPCGNVSSGGLAVRLKSCPTTSFTRVVFVSEIPVPVNVRSYSPAMTEGATVTFKTDAAGDSPLLSVTFGGTKAVVIPGYWGLAERLTVPLKVFRLVRVMRVDLEKPCRMTSCAGFGLRLNPGFFTSTATLVVWEMKPIVAFTRTLYVPTAVVELTLTVSETADVPPGASDTLLELSEVRSPAEDEIVDRLAVPVNPLTLVSVIVDIFEEPRTTAVEFGEERILKPFTANVPTMN